MTQQPRRKRGVILTPQGKQKLLGAIREFESEHNFGEKYTIEELSGRTGLDPELSPKSWMLKKEPIVARSIDSSERSTWSWLKQTTVDLHRHKLRQERRTLKLPKLQNLQPRTESIGVRRLTFPSFTVGLKNLPL
jgi:hypothetical protein